MLWSAIFLDVLENGRSGPALLGPRPVSSPGMIRVCIAGISGWVGRPLAEAIRETDDLELVAGVARGAAGERIADVVVSGSLAEALEIPFDVLVEYTSAETARDHVLTAVAAGRHVVIGSSGLSTADYAEIEAAARNGRSGSWRSATSR